MQENQNLSKYSEVSRIASPPIQSKFKSPDNHNFGNKSSLTSPKIHSESFININENSQQGLKPHSATSSELIITEIGSPQRNQMFDSAAKPNPKSAGLTFSGKKKYFESANIANIIEERTEDLEESRPHLGFNMNSDTNNNESYRAGSDSSLVNLKKTASFSAKKKLPQLTSEPHLFGDDFTE